MANITPVDEWSDIPQIEQTDYVLGGEGQVANRQSQALANRTENLKNTVTSNKTTQDNKNDSIDAAINDLNTNKVNKSDIVNNATTTESGKVLDGRMGKTLNDAITSNYNTLNTNKVNKSDVVNNYTTTAAGKVLDARVAVSLKTLIDGKQPSGSYVLTSNIVNNATTTVSGKVLDGRMGKTLNDAIVSNYNTLNTNKINKSDIVTNYTTNNNSKVLAASVGVSLKALIDTKLNKSDVIDNLNSTDGTKALSANQGRQLKLLINKAQFPSSGNDAPFTVYTNVSEYYNAYTLALVMVYNFSGANVRATITNSGRTLLDEQYIFNGGADGGGRYYSGSVASFLLLAYDTLTLSSKASKIYVRNLIP